MDFTEEMKRFALRAFARGGVDSGDVGTAMKEAFGLEAAPTSSQLARYNLDTLSGQAMSPAHQKLFRETREAARAEEEEILFAHRADRLRELARLEQMALRQKNVALAREILAQIARERGGLFTQRAAGASAAEVAAYVAEAFVRVREAVVTAVPDPQEQQRVLEAIQSGLEERGAKSGG